MHTLFVGIDVSMHTNEVLAMLQDGREVDSFRVANDLPGAEALVERLVKLVTSRRLERVVLGVEATGIYSWHLVQHLRQAPALQPFQPVVHTFNPKVVRGFKQAYPELPKTDRVDAWVIADRLRFGRLPAPGVLEDRYEALRRLTRTRYHLVQDLVRAKQRFLNALFLKFSSFAQDKPVGRTFGATALAFTVETECIEVLAATPIEELVERVARYSRGRIGDPEAVAAAVQKAARSSYRLPKALADPVNLELATHLRLIRSLEEQIETLSRPIEELLATIPNTLGSVKGLGPVYVAGIVAEIADIWRFRNHNAVAKYAGLAWSRHQSGKFESEETRLIRTGNRYLRYYLIEAACSLAVHDAEFKRYYQRKKAESKTHAHQRALALTARKLVRLVDHLLRSNRLYNPLGAPTR
ncbi:transposase [Symbiobacterium terraclitae]|uniref:Transposase n=1 Tax=Symbiobacterium terraclitae TaxID=557451 RepID=A0ABS4JQX1_9FIRM|nr:transposase [Symbiobacterium terraclitae]